MGDQKIIFIMTGLFTCHFCSITISSANVPKHFEEKHSGPKISCSICGETIRENFLENHLDEKHTKLILNNNGNGEPSIDEFLDNLEEETRQYSTVELKNDIEVILIDDEEPKEQTIMKLGSTNSVDSGTAVNLDPFTISKKNIDAATSEIIKLVDIIVESEKEITRGDESAIKDNDIILIEDDGDIIQSLEAGEDASDNNSKVNVIGIEQVDKEDPIKHNIQDYEEACIEMDMESSDTDEFEDMEDVEDLDDDSTCDEVRKDLNEATSHIHLGQLSNEVFDADDFFQKLFLNEMESSTAQYIEENIATENVMFENCVEKEFLRVCEVCTDDFYWPLPDHTCLFTTHKVRFSLEFLCNEPEISANCDICKRFKSQKVSKVVTNNDLRNITNNEKAKFRHIHKKAETKVRENRKKVDKLEVYKCPECNAVYSSKAWLAKHFEAKDGIRICCDQCDDKMSYSVCGIKHHEKYCQRNGVGIGKGKESNFDDFFCIFCKETFPSDTLLNEHVKAEHSKPEENLMVKIEVDTLAFLRDDVDDNAGNLFPDSLVNNRPLKRFRGC